MFSASVSSLSAAAPGEAGIPHREIFRRSVSDVSGDIFLLPQAYNYLLDPGDFTASHFRKSHLSTQHDGNIDVVLPPHPESMHGYAWDYDLRIPLAFYDPSGRWFKPGKYAQLAVQQDIAPTLADVLGIAAPDRAEGRILQEARIAPSAPAPNVVAVLVQDQMGWQYFAAHPQRLRFIRSLLEQSASFTSAQVAHVDVETSVGHAAIGSGAYARGHGITANSRWQQGLWAAQPVFVAKLTETLYSDAFPLQYGAPTLADVWLQEKQNKPEVLSLVSAVRASISLGGHGSMFGHNKKTAVLYLSEHGPTAGTFQTDKNFYAMPKSIEGKSVRPYAEAWQKKHPGGWFGNSLLNADGSLNMDVVRASPAEVDFESDLVTAAITEMKLGQHNVTDLVFVNFKSSDYCGHLFGYESEECGEVLDHIDAAVAKLVKQLTTAAHGQAVFAYTADHGAAPLPELSGGLRYDRGLLAAALNRRFGKPDSHVDVVPFIGASQLWVNRKELAHNGFGIEDVVAFLKSYQVPMAAPWNMLADTWRQRGKPAQQPFFLDVVSRDTLLAAPAANTHPAPEPSNQAPADSSAQP